MSDPRSPGGGLPFLARAVAASHLARTAGLALVLQVAGVALGYLLHVLLARWLDVAAYGAYVYAFAWATVLSTLAAIGLPFAALRFVAEHRARGDWSALRGALIGFPLLALVSGTALAALAAAVTWTLQPERPELTLAMGIVPLAALLLVESEMSRALGSVVASLAPYRVLRPLLTLVAVFAIVHAAGRSSASAAMAATVAALAAVLAVQTVALVRARPAESRRAAPRYQPRAWLRVARPLLVASGLSLLLTQVDLLVVGMLLADREVGLYNAAARTAALVSFVLFAVNVAAAPRISELHVRQRHDQLQRLVSQTAQTAFWPSLALTTMLVLLAAPVLGLFGGEFVAARWELRILAAGYLFNAAVGSVGYLLNLTGNERHNARALLEAAVLDVALLAVAVPLWGTLGAALATAATWVFVGLRLHRLARRHTGIRSSILAAGWRLDLGGGLGGDR